MHDARVFSERSCDQIICIKFDTASCAFLALAENDLLSHEFASFHIFILIVYAIALCAIFASHLVGTMDVYRAGRHDRSLKSKPKDINSPLVDGC